MPQLRSMNQQTKPTIEEAKDSMSIYENVQSDQIRIVNIRQSQDWPDKWFIEYIVLVPKR